MRRSRRVDQAGRFAVTLRRDSCCACAELAAEHQLGQVRLLFSTCTMRSACTAELCTRSTSAQHQQAQQPARHPQRACTTTPTAQCQQPHQRSSAASSDRAVCAWREVASLTTCGCRAAQPRYVRHTRGRPVGGGALAWGAIPRRELETSAAEGCSCPPAPRHLQHAMKRELALSSQSNIAVYRQQCGR